MRNLGDAGYTLLLQIDIYGQRSLVIRPLLTRRISLKRGKHEQLQWGSLMQQFLFPVLLCHLLSFSFVWGHGTKKHTNTEVAEIIVSDQKTIYADINQQYLVKVKAIFKRSCFDCHSSQNNYPWYYKIPGIKGMIDNDIAQAKKHLDLTHDFPFKGHDTALNDFSAILNVLAKKTMPPFGYRLMHKIAKLEQSDIKLIKEWIKLSTQKIKNGN